MIKAFDRNIGNFGLMEKVDLSGINSFLIKDGEYQIPKYKELLKFSHQEIVQFGLKQAMYTFPTEELIEYLKDLIGNDIAVEIGSGVGVLGKALGIKCTDSYLQERPEIKRHFLMMQQRPIKYGAHVEKREANWVAEKWKPDVILGSWITSYLDPDDRSGRGGNMFGPKEEEFLSYCKRYIMLGNEGVHCDKPLLAFPHKKITASEVPFYLTRSLTPEKNVIYIWGGKK